MTVPFSTHGNKAQGVLLGLVEPMDLVDEQDCPLAGRVQALLRRGDGLANVLDAREHGVQGREVCSCGVGDDACQGGLSGPGRPVEDHAGQAIGLDGTAQ
jgi:hypothetical protein